MKDYTNKIADYQVDVHTIWKLQCQNLYNSKNLGALAVRECLQNSLDAIQSAISAGQIIEGLISITIDGDKVIISDNGIGMDIQTLHEKFLTLGGTTKGDKDNVGGFGLAKSVILGCGTGFKVRTQDNLFTSEDIGKNPIQKTDFIQGTEMTLVNVQTGKETTVSDNPSMFLDSVLDYVLSSDIPVTVKINGKVYEPYFKATNKTHRSPAQFNISSSMIPDKTKLKINVYKDDSSRSKYIYIRLRGLTQFKQYLGWNSNCNIVLDFQTTLDPRSAEYPFSTNREGLKAQYYGIIEAIRDKVTQSPLSISSSDEYKETFYDNINKSVEQARAISSSISHKDTENIAFELGKIVDGIVPQGGYKSMSLVEKAKQYNKQLEELAEEQGVSKQELVKQMSADTVKKLDNPLEHSWIIWEDKNTSRKLNKTKAVDCILVWDSVLRIMAQNYSDLVGKVFYPGIVVKKDTMGLCLEKIVSDNCRTYIMLNPFEVKAEDDTQLALYLMGLASHELAHFVCGTYEAHGETFSYTREAIMNSNLSQLSTIVKIVKAGKLKKTLNKISGQYKPQDSFPIDFVSLSLEEVMELAKSYDVDIHSYREKYPNEPILRMRLIMAIKKAYKEEN